MSNPGSPLSHWLELEVTPGNLAATCPGDQQPNRTLCSDLGETTTAGGAAATGAPPDTEQFSSSGADSFSPRCATRESFTPLSNELLFAVYEEYT